MTHQVYVDFVAEFGIWSIVVICVYVPSVWWYFTHPDTPHIRTRRQFRIYSIRIVGGFAAITTIMTITRGWITPVAICGFVLYGFYDWYMKLESDKPRKRKNDEAQS